MDKVPTHISERFFMCLVCNVPIAGKDISGGKIPCVRNGHIMTDVPASKNYEDDRTLMRRAREKWHEFRKDRLRWLGVGF